MHPTLAYPLTAAILIVAAFCFCVAQAGHFLNYSEAAQPVDAAVLLIGQDLHARQSAAEQMLCSGQARYLIIPGYGEIWRCAANDIVVPLSAPEATQAGSTDPLLNGSSPLRSLAENTHIEMLLARQTIERCGLESAVFVSSPYHMRRIKLMAERLFDRQQLKIHFVATPYETTGGSFWWTDRREIAWVLSEYVKIAWFMIYEPFV